MNSQWNPQLFITMNNLHNPNSASNLFRCNVAALFVLSRYWCWLVALYSLPNIRCIIIIRGMHDKHVCFPRFYKYGRCRSPHALTSFQQKRKVTFPYTIISSYFCWFVQIANKNGHIYMVKNKFAARCNYHEKNNSKCESFAIHSFFGDLFRWP